MIQVWWHKVSETLTSWHSKIWSSLANRTSSPIRNPNPKNCRESEDPCFFFHMWDPIRSFSRTLSDIIISHTFTKKLPNNWGDGWSVTFLTPPCNAAWYESSSPRCYKLQILNKYVFLRLIAHNNLSAQHLVLVTPLKINMKHNSLEVCLEDHVPFYLNGWWVPVGSFRRENLPGVFTSYSDLTYGMPNHFPWSSFWSKKNPISNSICQQKFGICFWIKLDLAAIIF